jgi:DNA-binding response OmpR family regulator/nitrogen-specific signal transduction histidine kinase
VELKHELEIEHLEKQKQEELHQAKLNFFTNIAHEIRTPLTLMVGPVDHLVERVQDNSMKKELAMVKSNSDRLMRLLNQLLDFHKQETGNVKLKIRKENFTEFIRDTLAPFQDFAHARKISIDLAVEDECIPLWFDRDELSKVFYNLLVNAFKFTPGGGNVNVQITKQLTAVEGAFYVKITLEDNGLGIPAVQLEKIFHRFYQAENTGIQEAGFGIGLALAKGIIDLHQGQIHVESHEATNEEQGFTRFTILLRSGHAHFEDDQILHEELMNVASVNPLKEHAVLQSIENENIPTNTDKPLILVVEDNDEIRAYIKGILLQHYEVLEGRNGTEGWEIATENLPDLILSDVVMPNMSGLQLLSKLKNDQRTSHIPVIMLTARSTVNHQVEGLETGADDYLPKPFNVVLLQAKIKNHLAIREKLKEKYSRIVTLQPQHQEVEDPDDKFLQRLMAILEEHIVESDFNVSRLVREIGMSRPVLFRKTKMLTGLSVIDLIRNVRLKKAEMLLRQKKLSISEVAFTVGFSDPKYFSKTFRNHFGKTPSQYLDELE